MSDNHSENSVQVTIDGTVFEAAPGTTILEIARANGIHIPTLCYHPALHPSGGCRLCAVEVDGKKRTMTMLACVLKAKDGMVVRTESQRVSAVRWEAFQHLAQLAPQSRRIREMATAEGFDLGPAPDGCIRCWLCVRVCKEIVGARALTMAKREGHQTVVPVPNKCLGCGTCANLCPTHVIKVTDRDNVRTVSIRDEVIGQQPLERCEGCGKLYATSRFVDHVDHCIGPHPHVKAAHKYCPVCTKLFSDRLQVVRKQPPRRSFK